MRMFLCHSPYMVLAFRHCRRFRDRTDVGEPITSDARRFGLRDDKKPVELAQTRGTGVAKLIRIDLQPPVVFASCLTGAQRSICTSFALRMRRIEFTTVVFADAKPAR
jgi:hypothetical protein